MYKNYSEEDLALPPPPPGYKGDTGSISSSSSNSSSSSSNNFKPPYRVSSSVAMKNQTQSAQPINMGNPVNFTPAQVAQVVQSTQSAQPINIHSMNGTASGSNEPIYITPQQQQHLAYTFTEYQKCITYYQSQIGNLNQLISRLESSLYESNSKINHDGQLIQNLRSQISILEEQKKESFDRIDQLKSEAEQYESKANYLKEKASKLHNKMSSQFNSLTDQLNAAREGRREMERKVEKLEKIQKEWSSLDAGYNTKINSLVDRLNALSGDYGILSIESQSKEALYLKQIQELKEEVASLKNKRTYEQIASYDVEGDDEDKAEQPQPKISRTSATTSFSSSSSSLGRIIMCYSEKIDGLELSSKTIQELDAIFPRETFICDRDVLKIDEMNLDDGTFYTVECNGVKLAVVADTFRMFRDHKSLFSGFTTITNRLFPTSISKSKASELNHDVIKLYTKWDNRCMSRLCCTGRAVLMICNALYEKYVDTKFEQEVKKEIMDILKVVPSITYSLNYLSV